jgi:excinuclease UvrABC nuclease subunit
MYQDKFFRIWKGPFPFTLQDVKKNAPAKPGVYQLLYLGQVAYIGISTGSILDRLTKHVTGHGNWAAARRSETRNYKFVFFECDGVSARQIESHVITNNKPPFNVKPEYCNYIDNITVH